MSLPPAGRVPALPLLAERLWRGIKGLVPGRRTQLQSQLRRLFPTHPESLATGGSGLMRIAILFASKFYLRRAMGTRDILLLCSVPVLLTETPAPRMPEPHHPCRSGASARPQQPRARHAAPDGVESQFLHGRSRYVGSGKPSTLSPRVGCPTQVDACSG